MYKKKVTLSTLFPDRARNNRVFADWYSGKLRVPDGKELQYVHMGYGSTYERDVIYTVKAGSIVSRRVVDNTKKPLPDAYKRGKRELKKLGEWGKDIKQ